MMFNNRWLQGNFGGGLLGGMQNGGGLLGGFRPMQRPGMGGMFGGMRPQVMPRTPYQPQRFPPPQMPQAPAAAAPMPGAPPAGFVPVTANGTLMHYINDAGQMWKNGTILPPLLNWLDMAGGVGVGASGSSDNGSSSGAAAP